MLCASFLAMVFLEASRVLAVTTIPPSIQGYHWHSDSSTWSEVPCGEGRTYLSWSEYGRCCTDSNSGCNFPTSCDADTVYYTGSRGGGDSSMDWSRAMNSYCALMTIYESATTDPAIVDYFCWDTDSSWTADTIFRTTDPATATPRTSVTPLTPTATPRTSVAPTPASSGDTAPGSESSGSKTWIAGAVVGPVTGCGVIAALAFWFIRRSRLKKEDTVLGNEEFLSPSNMAANETGAQFGPPSELDAGARKPHELDAVYPISELPAPAEFANRTR
ncbi:hypothetical protein N7536_009581 [Penicillium majusculum]|uniref:Mid2 domain-containing protein n=1 Tax=Penicillium solitum TaxID=60172 RepID=A0A1V6R9P1_9EURO|nr:uncharacterized protein PENSOL_c010G04579 [Penicillium solitum]KAJ5686962.1 hypothetical protein N7536_009581 [Penicillium majusculum]OQD98129.1 hypothetical protein PENSOL_c010G04579 [Penicillium solitum]